MYMMYLPYAKILLLIVEKKDFSANLKVFKVFFYKIKQRLYIN